MSAYLILNFSVEDPELYAEYSSAVGEISDPDSTAEVPVNDKESENLEGDPGQVTIIFKYDSKDEARNAYNGDVYRALIPKRLAATSRHFAVLVDGVSE